ncbi:MAG: CinA family protein [Methylophilaceae bacterium]
MDEQDVLTLVTELGVALKAQNLMLALAESCTGGMAAEAVTSVAGSSTWFERGFVTYSNVSKTEMLGVSTETITTFGAVSEETAREMALGALKHSHADVAISITGIAGPDGGTPEKPVGTVCFAWARKNHPISSTTNKISGDRREIRHQSTATALGGLLKLLVN